MPSTYPDWENTGTESRTTTGCLPWWQVICTGEEKGCTRLLQKPPHAGLFVTNVSKASPKLFLACATGQHIKEAVLVGGVKEGKDRQEFFNVKLTNILTHQLVPARRIKRWHTYRPVQPRQTLPRQSTSTGGKKRMARLIGPCQGRIRSQGKQEGLADHLSLFILLELTHSLKKLQLSSIHCPAGIRLSLAAQPETAAPIFLCCS
jgi:hypothetical protein